VLNRLFYSSDKLLQYTNDISACRKAIDLNQAKDWIGQKVTVCGLVKSVSISPAITRISLQMSEGEKLMTPGYLQG
jgi:cytochrome c-type biogenesis protein CcmE